LTGAHRRAGPQIRSTLEFGCRRLVTVTNWSGSSAGPTPPIVGWAVHRVSVRGRRLPGFDWRSGFEVNPSRERAFRPGACGAGRRQRHQARLHLARKADVEGFYRALQRQLTVRHSRHTCLPEAGRSAREGRGMDRRLQPADSARQPWRSDARRIQPTKHAGKLKLLVELTNGGDTQSPG